jgi:hypothetical protein
MTVNQFAEITKRVIARDGFDGYLPTACYPSRQFVRVLEGVPAEVDLETASLQWALKDAQADEEIFVAFKFSEHSFKVVRILGSQREESVFEVA